MDGKYVFGKSTTMMALKQFTKYIEAGNLKAEL